VKDKFYLAKYLQMLFDNPLEREEGFPLNLAKMLFYLVGGISKVSSF